MRAGYSEALRRRVQRLDTKARLFADAIAVKAEDVRLRRTEWDAGTKTNVETFDNGDVQLTGTSTAKASSTTSDGYGTDLDRARPFEMISWELDAAIGSNPRLSKFEVFLNRRFNGGQPVFDGDFTVQFFRAANVLPSVTAGEDRWNAVAVTDPIRVRASEMTADQALVPFLLDSVKGRPPALVIGDQFIPQQPLHKGKVSSAVPNVLIPGRMIMAVVTANLGPSANTNYGIGRDSTKLTTITTGGVGTLRHRIISFGTGHDLIAEPLFWQVKDTAIGMTRATFSLAAYSATGSIAFTGAHVVSPVSGKMDLEQAVQGTVEFRVIGTAPPGTTLIASARVNGGDAWVPVVDGQTPADVGLANSQTYEMKADFTAPASLDVTPTLRELGMQDRVIAILADAKTDLVTLTGFEQRVDVITGESLAAEGHAVIQRTGVRDYKDMATTLVAENNVADIELRIYVGHEDLARNDWLHIDTFRVDDFDPRETEIDFTCVSLLERLMGIYPLATGQLFGYFLKAITSDLTAGTDVADFNRELSETAETGGTIAVSVAASATEQSRGLTKAGVPNLVHWPPGNWTVKINVTVANTNIQLSVAVARVDAAGTQQEISAFSDEQQATAGVKVFTVNNLSWAQGLATDRLKLVYRFRNTAGSIQAATIETGTVNTEVIAPWTTTATVQPATYNNVTVKAAYEDWRDVQVGLAERYRGSSPSSTDVIFLQGLADADGKRWLERFAFVAGGWIYSSQGRIKFADGYLPTAAIVASFALEETRQGSVSPGLRSRVPDFTVPFGFDNGVRPNDFAGQVQFIHQGALTKFGKSRIDNPVRKLERETARMVPDVYLATQIGEPFVQALGTGLFLWPFESLVPRPELEIGDPIAFETDSFAMLDPTTGEAVRGPLWAVGRVAEVEDLMGRHFAVWIRGFAALWAISRNVYRRQLFEPPTVQATIGSIPGQPQNAQVRLREFPPGATIKWYSHADGTAAPDRGSELYSTYSAPFTIARDPSVDKLVSYYAIFNGIVGQLLSAKVPPGKLQTIVGLSGGSTGTTPNITVTFTAVVDPNVRRLRWYIKKNGWPTTGGGLVTDPLDAAQFVKDVAVSTDGGGFDATGNPVLGGLTCAAPGVYNSTGDNSRAIVLAIDADGNVSARASLQYTVPAAPPTIMPTGLAVTTS